MLELFDYQDRAVEHYWTRVAAQTRFSSCLQAPTGAGKTHIMAAMLRWPMRHKVLTYRRVILDQLAGVLDSLGISYGFRAAGYPEKPEAIVQLSMVQTELRRRNLGLYRTDLLHVDEIHSQLGPQYTEIFDAHKQQGASLVGYTATPYNMSEVVDDVYVAATVPNLIERGRLCQPRVFNCSQAKAEQLERLRRDSTGEFTAADVGRIIQPGRLIGHVIPHLERLSPDGRPFVLFAHSVKASLWWAQSMTYKGIPTAHIDGADVWVDGQFFKSNQAKRQEVFDRLNDGSLRGVSNRFVLREGWDCPVVGHAILCCPVGLRKTLVQMCGRVLRAYGNREYAVIQDHCGSTMLHPALDSGEPWDWRSPPGLAEKIHLARMRAAAAREEAGEPEEDDVQEPIVCPQCRGQRAFGDTCPFCGFYHTKRCHYVIQTNGQLRLVNGRLFRPRRVKPRPTDATEWARVYWRTCKNGKRTFEQAYAYYAYSHNWRWLPRDLPGMPICEADWFLPVAEVPRHRLLDGGPVK